MVATRESRLNVDFDPMQFGQQLADHLSQVTV